MHVNTYESLELSLQWRWQLWQLYLNLWRTKFEFIMTENKCIFTIARHWERKREKE